MDKCSSWQPPFQTIIGTNGGSTAQASCNSWAKQEGAWKGTYSTTFVDGLCTYVVTGSEWDPDWIGYTDYATIEQVCEPETSGGGQTINCDGACTVSLALVSPELEPEKFQDMAQIGGLFAGAAIVILCIRKLYDLFDKAPHGDS